MFMFNNCQNKKLFMLYMDFFRGGFVFKKLFFIIEWVLYHWLWKKNVFIKPFQSSIKKIESLPTLKLLFVFEFYRFIGTWAF